MVKSINYAQRLKIDFVYAANGHKIYEHSLLEGKGSFIENYPTDLCFNLNVKTRAERVLHVEDSEFILERYEKDGVKELDEDKLGKLVDLSRLGSVREITNNFGGISEMRDEYFESQREIYK